MSTSLAQLTDADFSREKIELIKQTVAAGTTDIELQLFLYTSKKMGLDPLAKQIYAIKRLNQALGREVMTIQTGIDGYRVVADRTGRLAGISDPSYIEVEGAKNPKSASVTVKKLVGDAGMVAEFTATARWEEYVVTGKGGMMWTSKPYLMLGKCAEALALRKAFPADLSGVYTSEEMAQADNDQQRDAVYAEVDRQKAAYTPSIAEARVIVDQKIEAIGSTLPPELEWSYSKTSGVLICRLMSVAQRNKKKGEGTYLTIKLNGAIEGKDLATYFHNNHREDLLASAGKICKFTVSLSKEGFINVDEVLEVDGKTMERPSDSETQARLLASTMDITEEQLAQTLKEWCDGSWPIALDYLRKEKAGRESETEGESR